METTSAHLRYWLAFQAMVADVYGADARRYAVLGSRIQAAMGLGYAIASLAGGRLAARDVRLAYTFAPRGSSVDESPRRRGYVVEISVGMSRGGAATWYSAVTSLGDRRGRDVG